MSQTAVWQRWHPEAFAWRGRPSFWAAAGGRASCQAERVSADKAKLPTVSVPRSTLRKVSTVILGGSLSVDQPHPEVCPDLLRLEVAVAVDPDAVAL